MPHKFEPGSHPQYIDHDKGNDWNPEPKRSHGNITLGIRLLREKLPHGRGSSFLISIWGKLLTRMLILR